MRQRLIGSIAIGWLSVACAVSAQTSPDGTVIPPASTIATPTDTWSLLNQAAYRDPGTGLVYVAGNVDTITWLGTVIYLHDAGGSGYYQFPAMTNVGQTLPNAQPPVAHACDGADAPAQTIAAGPHALTACWTGQDTAQQPVSVTGWVALINSVAFPLTMTKGTTANTAGLYEYSSQAIAFPPGTYPVTVRVDTTIGSASAAVVTVTATSNTPVATPQAPVKVTVH